MRRTPPVVVQIEPLPAVQAIVALVAALTAGGLALWAISHDPRTWPALLLVPAAAAWAWREARARPRRLRWDGQAWWLADAGQGEADEKAVSLAVLVDLDASLLLLARPGPCWLALARRQEPARWGALRATLFAAPAGQATA